MDLELSDEQLALQDSVRDFLEAECPVSLVRRVVEEDKGAEELWGKMVELDWPAMAVGESEGGTGLGFVELAVVAEELGRALAPVPFLSTASQFVGAVRLGGSPEQRRRFLAPVAERGMPGALAVAEAGGDYDTGATRTTAERSSAGWLLNGEKHFVIDGATAEEVVVSARFAQREDADGPAKPASVGLFVVPQESLSSAPIVSLDATRQFATVTLDDVEVSEDRLLERPAVIERVLEESTAALSAEIVGTCQAMFDIVHSYVLEREQFGVKIGSFQAIKHKLADMYVALESARALCYFAALCIAEDDERRSLAVSAAKAGAGDCQRLVAQQSIQSLGGIGYTWEHDIHFFVKRVKASTALFGTADAHRARIAAAMGLGDPGDTGVSLGTRVGIGVGGGS